MLEYVSCEHIENGITFDLTGVRACCRPGREIFIEQVNEDLSLNVKRYLIKRNEIKNVFKSGNILPQCDGCSFLEKSAWGNNQKIKYITIAHATKCSTKCIYCEFTKHDKFYKSRKHYQILPLLECLYNNDLIDDEAIFDICGGECTEYGGDELKNLLQFIMANNYYAHIFTSGLFYSFEIAEILSKGLANLYVSVDSGTEKTFKKIKQINSYHKVWSNLEKYISKSKVHPSKNEGIVHIKYIIIPGINDNYKEFDEFVKKCLKIKCSHIVISLENNWWFENRNNPIPENILGLLDYTKKFDNYFTIEYIDGALDILNQIDLSSGEKMKKNILNKISG